MRIHLVPNSHIDPVWLWDKYEGIDEVVNTFRSACDRLDEIPGLTFTASSLQFYEWVLTHDTALFERIAAKVAEGRWEVAGGWWVEADSNLPTGHSLAKHAELSQAFALKHFGREIRVAYLPDSFGHPATLPKILADAGFRYFVFCRPGAHEKPDLPANLFYWEYGGARVLAYRLKHHYLQYGAPGPSEVDPNYLVPKLEDAEYRECPVNAYLFGVGDHGGGPAIAEIEFYRDYIRRRPSGDIGFSTCERFFDEAAAVPGIPAFSGDLHMHAVGCYSVVRDLKAAARQAEHDLQLGERALAMDGRDASALTPLWKTTLFNQFHDILPGSCSPAAADAARAELGGVSSQCADLTYGTLKKLARGTAVCSPTGEFRVFNTLPHAVTVPLAVESFMYYREGAAFRDAAGRALAVQEVLPSVRCANRRWEFVDTLPAQGFKSYHFDDRTHVKRPAAASVHFGPAATIRGRRSRITPTGNWLAGATSGNQRLFRRPIRFLVLSDDSDTWGHGVCRYESVEGEFTRVSSSAATGAVTNRLYQRWTYGRSSLEMVYSLYPKLLGVIVDVAVMWAEHRKILKMQVEPAGEGRGVFTMQAPGGAVRRATDGLELPLHHWLRLPTGRAGLALLQAGAFACDCRRNRLRVTLVRSSVYGFHDPTRLSDADPQRLTDQGEHRFRFRLLPGSRPGADVLDREAATFLEPCPVIREGPGPAARGGVKGQTWGAGSPRPLDGGRGARVPP